MIELYCKRILFFQKNFTDAKVLVSTDEPVENRLRQAK